MKRGVFLASSGALAAVALGLPAVAAQQHYAVTHSDSDWQRILGPDRYAILRQNGTEPAYSSPLLKEMRSGIYSCAGCGLANFSSRTKYDSGEGWPSFWNVLPNAVLKSADYELVEERTEVHCRRCGSHLGHLFDDGPPPTNLRYCIDGLALTFKPGRSI